MSGILCLAVFGWLYVDGNAFMSVAEPALDPWFFLCRTITPIEWRTFGNIPLGLLWLSSGLIAYSMTLSALCIAALTTVQKIRAIPNKVSKDLEGEADS